jgi:hypothetical protein
MTNRYTKLDNGYIHDALLNVEWHRESFRASNFQAAVDKCTSLGEGWRMPTMDELSSLIDRVRSNPACDPILNMPFEDWHWSSSPVVGWPEYAWYVNFYGGDVNYNLRNLSGFVRPVRAACLRVTL